MLVVSERTIININNVTHIESIDLPRTNQPVIRFFCNSICDNDENLVEIEFHDGQYRDEVFSLLPKAYKEGLKVFNVRESY